jgi:hypothetical protein
VYSTLSTRYSVFNVQCSIFNFQFSVFNIPTLLREATRPNLGAVAVTSIPIPHSVEEQCSNQLPVTRLEIAIFYKWKNQHSNFGLAPEGLQYNRLLRQNHRGAPHGRRVHEEGKHTPMDNGRGIFLSERTKLYVLTLSDSDGATNVNGNPPSEQLPSNLISLPCHFEPRRIYSSKETHICK